MIFYRLSEQELKIKRQKFEELRKLLDYVYFVSMLFIVNLKIEKNLLL